MTNDLRSDYFVYVMFRHDTGIPFYVGKGSGRRIGMTKWRRENPYKRNIILKAETDKCDLPIVKIATELTEAKAFEIEIAIIAAIGRWPNGPLVNATDGGEGSTGYIATPETRAKLGRPGRKQTKEWIEKRISVANKGRIISEETRQKMSKAAKKRVLSIPRNSEGKFGGEIKCSAQSS